MGSNVVWNASKQLKARSFPKNVQNMAEKQPWVPMAAIVHVVHAEIGQAVV